MEEKRGIASTQILNSDVMSDVKMESKTYRKDFLEYEYQARSDVGRSRLAVTMA